eukprot:INCI9415.2.p1 GENE.INCI9415.2~~INCI9415.2.p1  ORF type:complete len:131 (-),score=11.13 INCI9415.2:202-594(-)
MMVSSLSVSGTALGGCGSPTRYHKLAKTLTQMQTKCHSAVPRSASSTAARRLCSTPSDCGASTGTSVPCVSDHPLGKATAAHHVATAAAARSCPPTSRNSWHGEQARQSNFQTHHSHCWNRMRNHNHQPE